MTHSWDYLHSIHLAHSRSSPDGFGRPSGIWEGKRKQTEKRQIPQVWLTPARLSSLTIQPGGVDAAQVPDLVQRIPSARSKWEEPPTDPKLRSVRSGPPFGVRAEGRQNSKAENENRDDSPSQWSEDRPDVNMPLLSGETMFDAALFHDRINRMTRFDF